MRDAGRDPRYRQGDRVQDPVASSRTLRDLPGLPGRQQPARLSGSARPIIPAQRPPLEPRSRRRRRQQERAETAGRPTSKRARNLPRPHPAWQSPTAIITALAVIATIVLIIVFNTRAAPPSNPLVLTPPAVPVADSIAREGTILGSSGAPLKVDAWEDFQCPFCRVWTIQWEPHIVEDFVVGGVVRYQFHDYAFLGTGFTPDESLDAAVAAQCANDQGKFWQYHDWLYVNQNPNGENKGWFVRTTLDAIALKVGLDQATFDTCLADPAKAVAVQAERSAAIGLGVTETPSIFVSNKLQKLTTYADLAALIRSLAPAPPSATGASGSPPTSVPPSGSAVP